MRGDDDEHDVTISAGMIKAAVQSHTGTVPTSIRSLSSASGNRNYLAHGGGGDFILKAAPSGAVATEAWVCDRVRAAGVPSPLIVAVDLDCDLLPLPYLLMASVPGELLAAGDDETVIEAGQLLRTVHEIGGTGFGPLDRPNGDEGSPRGVQSSWGAFLTTRLDRLEKLTRLGLLDEQLAARLRATIADHRQLLGQTRHGSLLHGDLCPTHLFTADGHLSGIIDWGGALVGDPAFDLAIWANAAPLDLLLRGYQPEADSSIHHTIAFYRVASALTVIADERSADASWLPGLLQGTRNALDDLDLICRL